jgi:hypothetical protein
MDGTIDKQYEEYINTRKRVLAAATKLMQELPLPQSEDKYGRPVTEKQDGATQAFNLDNSDLLNTIEKRLLPAMAQHTTTSSYATFLEERQAVAEVELVNNLDRLGDESQLLLAYPLLARSGRFEHARSAFGKKTTNAETGGTDEVTRRLEPWLFAAEAADIASSTSITAHLKQGNHAMDSVSKSLLELQLLRESNDELKDLR